MATFNIRKNSTLPLLIMKCYSSGDLDYDKFLTMMNNCAITFSMIDVETNQYIIANREAGVYIREKIIESSEPYEYYIYYRWREKDTKTPGMYKAEFKLNFFGDNCGSLTVPIMEDLYINIQDSITKTTIISFS